MKCPGCGNEEKDGFVKIDGKFTIETGDWHKTQEDVSLYGCTKCSCVIVSGYWKFQQKESTPEQS